MDVNESRLLKLKGARIFSHEERRFIIEEYLATHCTKQYIWEKYTGRKEEHGELLKWMRMLGYDTGKTQRSEGIIFAERHYMPKVKPSVITAENFELNQLESRIKELEKQLKDAEQKAIAFSVMIDVAEDILKVPIRKKFNTKP